jgi:hypothetical protein
MSGDNPPAALNRQFTFCYPSFPRCRSCRKNGVCVERTIATTVNPGPVKTLVLLLKSEQDEFHDEISEIPGFFLLRCQRVPDWNPEANSSPRFLVLSICGQSTRASWPATSVA